MATVQDKFVLQSGIREDLADNNAGLISAADVRENMDNIVESMAHIIANSDFATDGNAFQGNVRAQTVGGANGLFIADSGVQFVSIGGNNIQLVPYPGNEGVEHDRLANLTTSDDHTQYIHVNGNRQMEGNLGLDSFWINSDGNSDVQNNPSDEKGLKFVPVDSNNETILVGSKTKVEFGQDFSHMNTAKGVAKAWVSFDASSGGAVVADPSFNIDRIERGVNPSNNNSPSPGIFIIHFKNPIPVPYVAMGQSNGTSNNQSVVDFDYNVVAIVERTNTYLTFAVRNDHGAYVDAKINDLVVFGLSDDNEQPDDLTATTTQSP